MPVRAEPGAAPRLRGIGVRQGLPQHGIHQRVAHRVRPRAAGAARHGLLPPGARPTASSPSFHRRRHLPLCHACCLMHGIRFQSVPLRPCPPRAAPAAAKCLLQVPTPALTVPPDVKPAAPTHVRVNHQANGPPGGAAGRGPWVSAAGPEFFETSEQRLLPHRLQFSGCLRHN